MATDLLTRLDRRKRVTDDGCWEWNGALTGLGYARMQVGRGKLYVHRVAYELHVGPVPDGLELDHLCRNRACFNPGHLEPVTRLVNMQRSQQRNMVTNVTGACQRGHDMDDWVWTNRRLGTRACRQCRNEMSNQRRARQRAQRRADREQGARTAQ